MKKHKKLFIASVVLSVVSISTIIVSIAGLYLSDKIIHAQVLDQTIFIKNEDNAISQLKETLSLPKTIEISIKTPKETEKYSINTNSIDAKIDYSKTVNLAREGTSVKNLFSPVEIPLQITYDKEKLSEQLSLIAGQLYIPPVYPTINSENTVIVVTKGEIGHEVDVDQLENQVQDRLANLSDKEIVNEMNAIGQVLGTSDENLINDNYKILEGKSISLVFNDFEKSLTQDDLIKIISNVSGFEETPIAMLIEELSVAIETEPKEPVFKEEDGKVVEFTPATNGIKIRENAFHDDLQKALDELIGTDIDSVVVDVPVSESEPKIKTADVNDYGINELIGRGSSKFVGSIPNRIHNVALAAEKISGTLVAPGETFSFNKTIGDISVYTGFKQSYVIQDNRTVLGDGGGVCQVSTTLFRAALNAGLPIAERRAHSYRVGYYEQGSPIGLDATIYSPTVDLKITNDTPNYMLIQAYVDTNKMTLEFELYGTKDGREVTLTDPVVTSRSPAPEDLFIDDPSKPAGYIEQIDYAAAGARVEYDYKVVRGDEVLIDKTFYSNYRPWQAKFIRGTGPAQ